jgi:4-amino-4-deoxy-L-arabinose transferase-like glycosyltransferase
MSATAGQSATQTRRPRLLSWIALAAIVLVYLLLVIHLHPSNFFGYSQDDTLYFSSAKAIAEGHGYILPSVPGTPAATKYPILYPWMLSWVWRLNSSFPANLSIAVALNLAFGVAYLVAAFIFLRRLPKLGDAGALLLTGICMLNPRISFLSANLMSDIPFAACALAACVVAAKVTEKEAGSKTTLICGILTGLSILIRAMGLPMAAGLCLAILLRSGWRKATVLAACVLPFVVGFAWRSMFLTRLMPPVAASSCAQSWRTTWLYYTSYVGFWRADVLSHGVFWQTLASNLRSVLVQPAMYFVQWTFIHPEMLALVLLLVLCALTIRGATRLFRMTKWEPIYLALGFSILPMLIWDYAVVDRFMIPFLPLICAAIFAEMRHIVLLVRHAPGKNSPAERRIAAGFLGLSAAVLLWGMIVSWRGEVHALAKASEERAALLNEKRAAYSWLKQNTASNARVVAYEDASLFLYSGRQSLRPVIFSASGVYRPEVLNTELGCINSNAAYIGASYWMVSDDDFKSEWEPASSRAHESEQEMEKMLLPVFRSEHGGVRIYRLDSDSQPAI